VSLSDGKANVPYTRHPTTPLRSCRAVGYGVAWLVVLVLCVAKGAGAATTPPASSVGELHVYNVPYSGDVTDVIVAALDAPIAGDMIVSRTAFDEMVAWTLHEPGPLRTFDYNTADPGTISRVWQLAVDAPDGDPIAADLGANIDGDATTDPTVPRWLSGAYRPIAPSAWDIPDGPTATADVPDGICVAEGCAGFWPRDIAYGRLTAATSPPLPDGTLGTEGEPITATPTDPPATTTLVLSDGDRQALDLIWIGVFLSAGLGVGGVVGGWVHREAKGWGGGA
jgi:hypothetical protein